MSIAEIERFAADLMSSEGLRAEAEKDQTSVVAFAASKGYVFTADDMKDYAKARKLITDAELDGVAGGAVSENPWLKPDPMAVFFTAIMQLKRNMG